MEAFKDKCKSVFRSRGCFGCFTKPSLITAVDDPSQRLKVQGQKVKRSSFSEDFWNSSACEMEHSGVRSQRSMSSNNTSNLDPSGSTSQPSEFINHGLLLWNQTRRQWLGNKRPEKHMQPRETTINWNTIYESLHCDYKPFPRPIPLPVSSPPPRSYFLTISSTVHPPPIVHQAFLGSP
ncbi:uncharacterized protein LOC120132256 isoform X1 [Hibiscus syriacus]|uniref:uncharacterized protein LOC120132256 isoform X1 n=1 Tax=Hibiscus syriacus TaxID=106335 RepID=UPI0019204F20|nr:uncharacterized protein LOC120132256 isoform X1 [Hibiscus syriacus]